MLNNWISTIAVTIVCVVSLIKGIQSSLHYLNYTIPQQLVQLVKQAHLGQSFQTMWNIEVSDTYRDALRAPLTLQQIHTLSQKKDDIVSTSINCYVLSHKLKAKELSGVVSVSVNIESRSRTCNYTFSQAKLRITVNNIRTPGGDSKWFVSSVEQL